MLHALLSDTKVYEILNERSMMPNATKIEMLFDQLVQQTRQRGGSPSVANIIQAALAVQTVLACYSQVREQAVQPGMSQGLSRAVKAMDGAVAALNGE